MFEGLFNLGHINYTSREMSDTNLVTTSYAIQSQTCGQITLSHLSHSNITSFTLYLYLDKSQKQVKQLSENKNKQNNCANSTAIIMHHDLFCGT